MTWANKKKSKKKKPFVQTKAPAKSSQKSATAKLTNHIAQAQLRHQSLRQIGRDVPTKHVLQKGAINFERKSFLVATNEIAFFSKQSDDCDVLHTYDKEKIRCVVKEVTPNEVKYVPCAEPEAAPVSISRSKVRLIAYSDGRMQIVDQATREASGDRGEIQDPEFDGEPKVHPLAIISPVLGAIGLIGVFTSYAIPLGFLLTIAGMILGIVAAYIIKRRKKYRGKGLANLGILIGGGVLLFFVGFLLWVLTTGF